MRMTEHILAFTLLGSEWVLWLLVLLSILSVAVMVERAIAMSGRLADFENLSEKLHKAVTAGDDKAAREILGAPRCPEVRVALTGLDELARGSTAAVEAMASARSRERLALEKNLGILGTLGNNAPFIGLFGTVLGIIKAFADLAKNQGGGAAVVMSGIAEALVATAVGLMVALPAVVAFNIFQGRIRRTMGRVDALAHMILTGARDDAGKASDKGERTERTKGG
jgi:biopolymer transport protein ExbB